MKQAQGKQMPKIRKCLRMDMAKNQKSYTPEFKQKIVDLYHAGGTSYPQRERE